MQDETATAVADNLEEAGMPHPMNAPPTVTEAPAPVSEPPPQELKKFIRKEVADLFWHLGYAEAHGWVALKMGKVIQRLPTLDLDDKMKVYRDKLSPERRKLYDELLASATAKDTIEIVGDAEAKGKKPKTAKAAKSPRSAARPPSRKEGVKRDAFGCAKGTRGYDAMAVLTRDTPMKVPDIVKATGHEGEFIGVFYNFLSSQVEKGNVKKSEKGYTLTSAGEKKKLAHANPDAAPAPTSTSEVAPPAAQDATAAPVDAVPA